MALLESGEMYLETIYVLSQESDRVRGIDIGDYMGFSRPSVSRALSVLRENGFVEKDSEGSIKLTKSGEDVAKRIYERHTVLTKLLMGLGVDEETATEDSCRIEHYISDKSFEAIKSHMKEHEV
jgi:Mn-dependent DtxR family transcriptional regulator